MCGIAGYSGKGDERVLTRMNDTLAHRGPDDKGVKVWQNKDHHRGSVGLAQRRLAIIDLSPAGHQPMSNEDGTVWVAFNGEIYNHADLRATLTHHHTFRGTSDTEIIVHLYEEQGPAVFAKLEGMFAVALYDTKKDRLFLARDRMGKKPLYWSVQKSTLIFGSELKALMAHPSFVKELDTRSLEKYFLYEYVPTPHTILRNTYKLEPGTYLEWNGAQVSKTQFWKPHFLPKSALSFGDAVNALDAALAQATARRLVADVPLGIFLSGGIDSSVVAYYATRMSTTRVQTFSIGFDEPSFDESRYARVVAEHLGTEHHEHIFNAQECLDLVPQIGELLDEPMADASIVPTYLLARFTHEHVTVALGGDGGDELLCGYDTFAAHKMAEWYARVPPALRAIMRNAIAHIPTSHRNLSLDFKLKKFVEGFEGADQYRDQRWLGAYSDADRAKLLAGRTGADMYEDIDKYFLEMDSHERYDELAYLYQRMYMMDEVLVKVDRASMAHALEVRAPFLDTQVVDLLNTQPTQYKMRGVERKYLLKKLMEGKLPREIVYRKKKGFGMPIGQWLRGPLAPLVDGLLSAHSLAQIGMFDAEYVARLVAEHRAGTHDHRKKIWTLLVFMMWWRKWMA